MFRAEQAEVDQLARDVVGIVLLFLGCGGGGRGGRVRVVVGESREGERRQDGGTIRHGRVFVSECVLPVVCAPNAQRSLHGAFLVRSTHERRGFRRGQRSAAQGRRNPAAGDF